MAVVDYLTISLRIQLFISSEFEQVSFLIFSYHEKCRNYLNIREV